MRWGRIRSRGGFSPVTDIKAYQRLRAIYTKWRPALVQHLHAKPVILGPLAARRALGDGVRVVNAITGLGHAFISGWVTSRLAGMGYGLARSRADRTIFQNRDDRALFVQRGWVDEDRAMLISGSCFGLEKVCCFDV